MKKRIVRWMTLGSLIVATVSGVAETIEIRNVHVISMVDGEDDGDELQTIRVVDGWIESVGSHESAIGEADLVVDGKGGYVLPGLIDMHVHVWGPADLKAYPSFGVTTVRNLSGMPFHLEYAREIEAGERIGPRLITSGPILNSLGPNAQVNHKIVETGAEARVAVKEQYEQGFRLVKVYSNLTRAAYEAILEEAKALGMDVTGHPPEGERLPGIPFEKPFLIGFDELLDDGFQCMEHMESIVWHALYDRLDKEAARELAEKIAAAGLAVDPTLVAHHNLLETAATHGRHLEREGMELLNPFIKMHESPVFEYWTNQPEDTRQAFEQFYFEAVSLFDEAGVTMVTGSDAGIFCNIPGDALHQEFELLRQAGLSNETILQMATVNGAKVLGLEDRIGQVSPGFAADLILLEEDPREDLERLRELKGVVMQGRFYDEATLAGLREEAGQASFEATQERVLEGLRAQGTELE